MFDRIQPYNDLPLLPPAIELETKAVLKQAIAANRVLANLRGLAAKIPNQGLLLTNCILRQKPKLSPKVTTNDEFYRTATKTFAPLFDMQLRLPELYAALKKASV